LSSAEITSKTFQIIAENGCFLYLIMALKRLFHGQKRQFVSRVCEGIRKLPEKQLKEINCHFPDGIRNVRRHLRIKRKMPESGV
jgi:hypothetical protein